MSYQINLPVNQVRLTNVAVVRLSRGGHRFEVACYRNKIVNYRQGTETDLSEVLQTERVFTNVSKGQFANTKTLQKCFDTSDEEEVCRFILSKGDVQVSDQERAAQLESMLREVASMVSEKCVHPVTRRPYTTTQVRDAMRGAGFMVHPTRNVKQQFLDCVRLIQKKGTLEIERAKMMLALVLLDDVDEVDDGDGRDDLAGRRKNAVNLLLDEGVIASDIQAPSGDDDARIVFLSDPSLYRKLEGIARNPSVRGRPEIVQQCVTEEGDVTLGSELERRAQHQQRQDRHAQDEEKAARINSSVDAGDEAAVFASAALDDDDDEVRTLSNKLQSTTLAGRDNSTTAFLPSAETRNDGGGTAAVVGSRKAQKAAQKKSKKAKRREKEERAERDERIAVEKERQRARAERLGISAGAGDDDAAPSGRIVDSKGGGGGGEGAGNTKPCNTCSGAFTPGEYRSHFRSDWHRYNVKLKMKGCTPVSEREFLLCDSDAFF